MRTIQSFFIFIILTVLACDKEDDPCVKKASFDSGFELLNQTDLSKAESLFAENNLNYENKKFTSLIETDLNIIVKADQYVNGLKVFTEPLSYFFRKSFPQKLDFLLGDTLLPASIDLGITPLIESSTAFLIYKSIIEEEENIYWSSPCYVVEFGYYNLNVSSNLDQIYVPAWKVLPEGQYAPVAYINDTTQEVIYYFNGIYN